MVSCRFGGQLGNVMLEIYGVFYYAQKHGIDFSEVVFNRRYDVANQDVDKVWHYDYINSNAEMFANISSHFIDDVEYAKIPFYECQQKHILHGDDIDPHSHQHICFKKFDFHFPQDDAQRQLFCKLFKVDALRRHVLAKFPQYDIQDSCAVHVRRTDFKTFKDGRHLQTAQQVVHSIEAFIAQHKIYKFVVFSDDIEWCEQNIKPRNAKLFFAKEHGKDYEDMVLMSLAKDIMSGTSSFSYCAKLLNENIPLKKIKPLQY